ncbi:hypothetical protein J4526_06505 [Desulfurococcaceae archaeon MEX13E-LK6-19]|nr:hypothetical protein J4526_06505 [Desulfurococcaceae archaeon MEX13E-LK6-19]
MSVTVMARKLMIIMVVLLGLTTAIMPVNSCFDPVILFSSLVIPYWIETLHYIRTFKQLID